ncbi:MAG: peptidoglycan-binding protein [Patescibacteria group bacterium]
MKLLSNKMARAVFGGVMAFSFVLGAVFLPSSASAALLTRQLQFGMSGSDVSDLQVFLAADRTIYPQGLVTGYFGSLTRAAVMNFQVRNGISPVGRVGPQTLAVINAQMGTGAVVGTDRRAPAIGPVGITTASSAATFVWNTDENSSAVLYYSTNPMMLVEGSVVSGVAISGTSVIANLDLRSLHSVTLTGLQSNTRYYYVVLVKDASGNESITWPALFQTNQ